MNSIYNKVLSILSICFLGLIVYSNTFHAAFQLDDQTSIVKNIPIKDLFNLKQLWIFWPCRFITYLSIALNYHFHQLDVLGYHVFNLIVHIGTSLLVYWFVRLTLLTPAMKGNRIIPYANWVSFFAGLVFVSHPVQTEAVTYVVQRATSLAAFFYLLSLCFYVKSRLLQESKNPLRYRVYYVLAFIAAVIAMFTKEMAITLPLMILLYEVCFFKSKRSLNWKSIVPFLVIIVVIPITMVLTKYVDIQHLRRAGENPQEIDSFHYLLTQFRVIVTYLRLLILPIHQNLDYDYDHSKSFFEVSTMGSFLILASLFYLAKRLFKDYRLLSFSIFFFFLTLLPESSVLPIVDVIFEHRLYLPMVGYCLFLVSGLFYLLGQKSFKTVGMVLVLVIGINSFLTYERNKVWQDMFHLWQDTVLRSPSKERPWNNLGQSNDGLGNYTEALKDYEKALEINPYNAELYYNKGIVYAKLGQIDKALEQYNKAIELNPRYAAAYNNRSLIYETQGKHVQAISDITKAIETDPTYADAYSNKATALGAEGKFLEAILDYSQAIKINPRKEVYYKNRGNAYFNAGKINEALSDYNNAASLDPNDDVIYRNRAVVFERLGQLDKAIAEYTKAILANPRLEEYYFLRGNINYMKNSLEQAVADYSKVIELNPKYAAAYDNLVVVYLQLKDYGKARVYLNQLEKFQASYDTQRINALEKLLTGTK